MDTRKASAPAFIAAVHYILAGFVIPFLGGFLLGIVLGIAGVPVGQGPLGGLIMAPFSLLLLFLGVMYSSRFVQKRYIIPDAMQIVNLSTIYLVAIRALFMALGVAFLLSAAAAGTPEAGALPMIVGIGIVQTILETAVFYFSSKNFFTQGSGLGMDIGAPQAQTPQVPAQPQQ